MASLNMSQNQNGISIQFSSRFLAKTQSKILSIEFGPNSNEGPMKRPRGDKFETRVLVPSKVAGSVIGKGGSNIQGRNSIELLILFLRI